ncbi:MAG: PDZ domain-containing protein [candidate division WOR-3 bacterium]|nr:MAG: PDZ domain-containing protein [candidate division WOR-3 bacterium]
MKNIVIVMAFVLPLSLHADQEMFGYLGVATHDLSEAMRTALGIEYGLIVEDVEEGSPAQSIGLMAGDIILTIDDQKITDGRTLKRTVKGKPNERVTIKFHRKGKNITKKLTLGQREKSKLRFEVDMPDIPDLKVILKAEEMRKNLDELREELKELRQELEKVKERIK